MRNTLASWIVFIVLGSAMGFARYGGMLGSDYTDLLRDYGPWVFIGIYVMLILSAYKDSIFQGILSTLIPFYAIYWLFVVSDAFMVRAVVAGLMAGIGQDTLFFLQEHSGIVFRRVHQFISSGGGDI